MILNLINCVTSVVDIINFAHLDFYNLDSRYTSLGSGTSSDHSEDTEVPLSPERIYWLKDSGFRPGVH